MAYFVGNQQFPSVYAAARFLSQNPQPGVSITSSPVGRARPTATTKGMLTKAPVKTPPKPVKPAPVKQTAPVVPRQQTPGQSGPFDPAGGPVGGPPKAPPKPMLTRTPVKPAPAPVKQTAPIITPMPTPGQSGPFDPSGGPVGGPPKPTPTAASTAPSPEGYSKVDFPQPSAPEGVIEAPPPTPPRPVDVVPPAPAKPAPTTKEDVKAAEEAQPEMTFTFIRGQETGDANLDLLLAQKREVEQITEAELKKYFNDKGSKTLQQAFGDFDNYLAYMTEREQLIQSGDYDVGNWAEQGVGGSGFTEDQQMLMEGDVDLTVDPSDPGQDVTVLNQQLSSARQAAYNNWANSDTNKALLNKYGVTYNITNEDGDTYKWNGSAYVKTYKAPSGDVKNAMIGVIAATATAALGGAIGGALAPSGTAAGATGAATGATTGGFVSQVAGDVLANAIVQGAVTGEVDPSALVTAGISSGLDYVAEGIKSGAIAASSDAGAAVDSAIWNTADALRTDYDTVVDIATGIASGAIAGDDIEDIALGAVQTYTTSELQNYVRTNYADSMGNVQVDNLFEEDKVLEDGTIIPAQTTVPIAALNPFIETAVGAAFGEDVNATDIVSDIVDFATYEGGYLDEDGTLGFLDPGLDIPDIDLDLFGNVQLPDFGDTPEEIKAIEDVARQVGSTTEDVVRTAGSTAEDVVRTVGSAVAPIVEPPAQAVGDVLAAAEDVVRPIGSAAEDVVRPIGSAAEDVVRTVGSAADEYVIQPIREALPTGTTPEFDISSSSVDLPSVDLPSVDLPSLDLPSIGMPQFAGGGGGMFEGLAQPDFAYYTPEYRQIQLPKQVDYTAELNNIIARNSGMMS